MSYEPSFDTAVDFTLRQEGKLSNNPNDKGGLTKFGVTQERWTEYLKKVNVPALPKSVANITVDQAIAFYYSEFWKLPGIDKLPRELQVPAFDFYVNSGDNAIKKLQAILGVTTDGDLGPATLAKLEPMQAGQLRRLRNDYVTKRLVWLMDVAQHNPQDLAFIEGWAARVARLYDFAY